MSLQQIYSSFSRLYSLCILAILITTVNCHCRQNEPTSPSSSEEKPEGDRSSIQLSLVGVEEIIDNDLITFKITNQDTQEIDLSQIKVMIGLSNTKDFEGKENNSGKLISQQNPSQEEREIIQTLSALTQQSHLAIGKEASMTFRISDIDQLNYAHATCQLRDEADRPIAQKQTNWKLTTKINTSIEKETATVCIKDPQATWKLASSQLCFTIQISNTSDYLINLRNLKYHYEFGGIAEGKIEGGILALPADKNGLLHPKSCIDIPVSVNINTADQAINHILKKATDTDQLSILSNIDLSNGESLAKNKQQIKLICSAINWGPIPQVSKVDF